MTAVLLRCSVPCRSVPSLLASLVWTYAVVWIWSLYFMRHLGDTKAVSVDNAAAWNDSWTILPHDNWQELQRHDVAEYALEWSKRPWNVSSTLDWCHFDDYMKDHNRSKTDPHIWISPPGLLYVKVPKTASTTIAGIVRRIAHQYGKNNRRGRRVPCQFRSHHIFPAGEYYGNRNRSASLLLGSIRHPTARALSRVFFRYISHKGLNATNEVLLHGLQSTSPQYGAVSDGQGGYQANYLALQRIPSKAHWNSQYPNTILHRPQLLQRLDSILTNYDYILLVERLEESLVALQLLMNWTVGDLLSISAKVATGDAYYFHPKKQQCRPLTKAVTHSPTVHSYLSSPTWYAQNYGDFLLYAAVEARLNATIRAIGVDRFQTALERFRHWSQKVQTECAPTAMFPCSRNGTVQRELANRNCYQDDEGCGYPCIDALLQNAHE